ncbi:MAG: MBL fold metallo-hydrolase [Candidatus Nanopelagicales bacterium]
MLVSGFPTGPLGNNCFVVANGPGQECFIVDPGKDALAGIEQLVDEHQLTPVAVLITHGHFDHTWSLSQVCQKYGIPAYIHKADRFMLADPMAGMSSEFKSLINQMNDGSIQFGEPDEVREIDGEKLLTLAGIDVIVDHAPGHTQGTTVYRVAGDPLEDRPPVAFTGDFLFQGSIGRTDLPGGDTAQMSESLRTVILPMDDDTVVLPGHGATSTVGVERTHNPYLVQLIESPQTDLNLPEGN